MMHNQASSEQAIDFRPERRLAFVVGVDAAPRARTPALRQTLKSLNDAQRMAEVLTERCDFELVQPPLLGEQASTEQVKSALLRLAQGRKADDFLLFYFSGHGHLMQGEEHDEVYLVTHNFTEGEASADPDLHLSLRWLQRQLYYAPSAGKVLLILDCCYAGEMARYLREYFRAPSKASGSSARGLRVTLSATGHLQRGYDKGEHGLMTALLLDALEGRVDEVITAEDQSVHLQSIQVYLQRHMPRVQQTSLSGDDAGQTCILTYAQPSRPEVTKKLPQIPDIYLPFSHNPLFQTRPDELEGRGVAVEAVHYKNAKVVLVGESGVGKSGLALVLTERNYAPTDSTHGRHIWLFESHEDALEHGVREQREAWLWDLAGQRDYRLIHQLHLHEATIALIVFDPARDTDPLSGVRYWQRALHLAQQARGPAALPLTTLLVAARMDRGGRSMSRERLEAEARQLGCAGYIETSAKTGSGIAELRQAIRSALDWKGLPSVTSSKLLQDIKEFILSQVQSDQLLRTLNELYQNFLRISGMSAADETPRQQFEDALGRLEAQGMLRRFSFGDLILLKSELLDAYASALLIAVRNEPHGLGIVAEERVRQGRFDIPDEDRLKQPVQEYLLLIAMIEEFVRHELVLRESGFLLFPSQSTREHPEHASLAERASITFSFAGPTLSIYTTLVVRLTQSGFFQKQDLWQHVVTYTTRLGGEFGLLLQPRGEERAELSLFFDDAAREEMRFHFEDFVWAHLQRHATGSVERRRRIVCPTCGEVFTEKQINNRRQRGFAFIQCSTCDTKVSLLHGVERLSNQPAPQVKVMEREADEQREKQRRVSTLEGKRATQDFDVFLCYNNQDRPTVLRIGTLLKEQGILPWLDEWESRPGLPWQRALEQQIEKIGSVAVCVGENGIGPWQRQELDAFLLEFVRRDCPVIPVLLPDAPNNPQLPLFLSGMPWVDFRVEDPDPMQRLLWGITGRRETEEMRRRDV